MKTIEISDPTFDRLARFATPLEGADAVIRRLLDERDEATSTSMRRPKANPPSNRTSSEDGDGREEAATPEAVFYPLLVQVLSEFGGRAEKGQATRRIGELLSSKLTGEDREQVSSGELRWENKVAWGRNHLKELGYIKSNSIRGVWELTERGMELARTKAWPETWMKA